MNPGTLRRALSQERIVLLLAVGLFMAYAGSLPSFLAPDNLVAIVRSVAVRGTLAVGMGVMVIGRGIDLSMSAVMSIVTAWQLELMNDAVPLGLPVPLALGAVVLVGAANGFLAAYADVPP